MYPTHSTFPKPHAAKPSPKRRRAMAQPPELTADLIGEIILRLAPDAPACLARACLVCKLWRGIVSDPSFHGRYRAFHGTPLLLGFFHNLYYGSSSVPRFVPIAASSPFTQPPEPDLHGSRALDCRHGRVLLRDMGSRKFAVWDPVTGHRNELHGPCGISYCYTSYSAVLLCGTGAGCDHLRCHDGGPFLVVLVCPDYKAGVTRACVYSSSSGAWGAPASVHSGANYFDPYRRRGAIVGDTIYLVLEIGARILKYDMSKHCLSMIATPNSYGYAEDAVLMPMEDGSLGLAGSRNSSIYVWSRKVMSSDGAARWIKCRVIELGKLIPAAFVNSSSRARVIGFAEGAGVIFVSNCDGIFMIKLKSGQARKVNEWPPYSAAVFPFVSFNTPDCCSTKLPFLTELRSQFNHC